MKKSLLPLAILLLAAILTGCSGSDSSAPPDEAQFIGFLVTFEKLGGETEAALEDGQYVFDVGDSVNFYVPSVRYGEGELDYLVGLCDSTVSDVSLEAGKVVRASGTQYITAELNDKTVWPNKVYQSGDRVWAEPVSGVVLASGFTVSYPGENPQFSLCFTVIPAPVTVRVNQMSAEHELLQNDEYSSGDMPDSLSPLPDTAYLVVETFNDDGSVSRQLCERPPIDSSNGDSSCYTKFYCDNGLCTEHILKLDW